MAPSKKNHSLSDIIEWLERTQRSIDIALTNGDLSRAKNLRERENLFMGELRSWKDIATGSLM